MHLRIEHHSLYRYEKPVSFSPHLVRLFPRAEPGRTVHRAELLTNPGAQTRLRRDLFDNVVARCNYPSETSAEMRFDLTAELELAPRNPFDFLLENYAVEFPFAYEPADAHRLALYLRSPEPDDAASPAAPLLPLPFWEQPAPGGSTVSLLTGLTAAFRQGLQYERRDTGRAHPPVETLSRGIGACRDFAVLQAAVLRELGLAARLVSGYVGEFGVERPEDRRAEGAMHAWTEVYLPGAGWMGLDPTNGVLCDEHHVATAVGLTPGDISPIVGSYYGAERVSSELEASIAILPQTG